MSYLNALRLHFAGQFQTNVSTVNNDPFHYDNAAFLASYQDMQGANMVPPNGWFNPQGDAAFRLLGCAITAAWTPDGAVPSSDPVLGYSIADSDEAVPAKLVDLDPEQQLVSEIWGLTVRIADANGNTLMSATYEVAAFMDIWNRAIGSGGDDNAAGAMYQSVLTGISWGDVSGSPFLTALQAAADATGLLSIKFNVDGMNLDFTSDDFMTGRITGTIGPASADEPQHLLIARQFMADPTPNNQGFFIPLGGLNFFPAVVDADAGCIYLDLGNAISTAQAGGPLSDLGDLVLGYYDPIMTPPNPAGTVVPLGTVPAATYAGDASWYNDTAGIAVLPLDATQLQAIAGAQLVLSGNTNVLIAEWSNGAFVRSDYFVYRMSPNDEIGVAVYAMQYGQPMVGTDIAFTLDPSQLQAQMGPGQKPFWPYAGPSPNVAEPTSAISFNATAPTDSNGMAQLTVTAGDPGSPRLFSGGDYGIDGQVYGIRPAFADAAMNDGPINESNFVSFLLWSGYTAPDPVTWTDVQPIFQQYANLYPVMNRFLDLGDYNQVVAEAWLLQLAFGLDTADPNSMPVTRDLSPAKRAAILGWLANPLPGTVAAAVPQVGLAAAAPPEPPDDATVRAQPKGGKAAAMARRVVLQSCSGDAS